MKSCCLQVELKLNVSPEVWRERCLQVVPLMLAVPGLTWKLWILDEESRAAGGIYAFSSRAAAEAYAEGAVIAAMRASTDVRDVNVRLLPVMDDLSQATRALVS